MEFDNGQHIYLRCCTAYVALIRKLGLQRQMREQDHLRVPVLDPASGVTSAIEATPGLPPPLHIAPSLLKYRHLGLRQKLRLGRPIWAMLRMGDDGRRELEDVSFADWLGDQGQSVESIRSFWDLIVLPTCNDRSEAVSARQAILVFQLGLLRDSRGAEIGVAKVGLSTVAERALDCFRAAGGEVRFGSALDAIDHDVFRGLALKLSGRVRAEGRGCEGARVDVVIRVAEEERVVGALSTDARGVYDGSVVIPPSVPTGDHELYVRTLGAGHCGSGSSL